MKEIDQLLNDMVSSGVIANYALFGAIAQMRYTEPVATLALDVLVAVPSTERIEVLGPIYDFCKQRGYEPEGDAVWIEAWPVQFIPAFSPLTREAMEKADTADFEGVPLRVVRADYLAVIALSVGRAKDLTRILALLESGSVTPDAIAGLAGKHDLAHAWRDFWRDFHGRMRRD